VHKLFTGRNAVQTPAAFEYERATSVEHALSLLQSLGPEARIVAGGHSLLPMMKLRLARPDYLIDINDLKELDYIRQEGDEVLIGALTRHNAILASDLLAELFPIFRDAEKVIADPVVRNRGTIGGSVCQADPAEDLSGVCAALHASAVIAGPDGRRTIPMREFHVGPYETAVEQREMLVEIRLAVRPGAGSAYEKVERRAGDWAIAAAGAALWMDGGTISDAGIGLTAVGVEGFSATTVEEALKGEVPSAEVFDEAGRLASAATSPADDQRGSAAYKRELAGELTRRALRRAASRALGKEA
jgi:aerobic carbon-monoxide dehydrogenase medium subunit